jgi:hypothetical protein
MICFNGCSFTYGEGFTEKEREVYAYPSIVGRQLNTEIYNISKIGSSNYLTFLRSAEAIQSKNYDLVFTQWTALNRLWLFPSPDTEFSTNGNGNSDNECLYDNRGITNGRKEQLMSDLRILNGDYHNILQLVQYCSILDGLASMYNTQSFYVNGILPFTPDLFEQLPYNDLTNELSNYSKELFGFDNRGDDEIISLHAKLLVKLSLVDRSKWVNIYDSFHNNRTDIAPAGHHPGIKSNKWMADEIISFLTKHDDTTI